MDEVVTKFDIKVGFNAFADTKVYERYMLNAAQFSAAKSRSEAKLLQDAVFDGQRMRSYPEFEKQAKEITDISQKTWLRTEYETCRRNVTAGAKFAQMQADQDLYPYWVYRGRMDSRERPEHVRLEGKVFRIGDAEGDKIFPPDDWNCRCAGDPVDGRYLVDNSVQPQTNAECKELLEKEVDPQFRYNPAIQGSLPNDHSYFDIFHSANDGSAGMFGISGISGEDHELTGLDSSHHMEYLMEEVSEWRQRYHVDQHHNIVIQNKDTYTNVRLSDGVITKITRHARGFKNLPETIEQPSEIWASWEDVEKQTVVLRNYILFGRICYMVKTRDGMVTDAFAVSRGGINKYRRGVILQ